MQDSHDEGQDVVSELNCDEVSVIGPTNLDQGN